MRRTALGVLLILAVLTPACGRAPAPAARRLPAFVLSVARPPRTPTGAQAAGDVYLVEPGSAQHLFTSAPDIEAAISPDGRWLLHAAETTVGPFVRELRLYDLRSRRDAVLGTDTFVSLGWADDRAIGVTAKVRKGGALGSHGWSASDYAVLSYLTPDKLEEMRGRRFLMENPVRVSLAATSPPAHLSFLAPDPGGLYFLGDEGIWRAKWGLEGGMELAWSFGRPTRGFNPEPSPTGTPVPDCGIPRADLATRGLPMLGPPRGSSDASGLRAPLKFRRLGDGAVRSELALLLASRSSEYPFVLAPDASRYLRVERGASSARRPLDQAIAEYDASGTKRVLVRASHAEPVPLPLGYVGDDVAYWSLRDRRADIWLFERATGTAHKLATLPRSDLRAWSDGPRLIGVADAAR